MFSYLLGGYKLYYPSDLVLCYLSILDASLWHQWHETFHDIVFKSSWCVHEYFGSTLAMFICQAYGSILVQFRGWNDVCTPSSPSHISEWTS